MKSVCYSSQRWPRSKTTVPLSADPVKKIPDISLSVSSSKTANLMSFWELKTLQLCLKKKKKKKKRGQAG